MAIKTISQFDAATPTSNDKILFEQNGEGKSTTLADLPVSTKTQAALNTKVNTADVLTINQIMTSPDLSGKVASASAVKAKISGFSEGFGNHSSAAIPLPDMVINLMLFFSTFNTCGLYVIRKESASAIFILPVKEATGITITKGNNSVILNNTTGVGGVYTLLY